MKSYVRITGARGGDDLELKVSSNAKALELISQLLTDDWVLLISREMEE